MTRVDNVIDALEANVTPQVQSTIQGSVGTVMRRLQCDVPAVRGSSRGFLVENDEPVRGSHKTQPVRAICQTQSVSCLKAQKHGRLLQEQKENGSMFQCQGRV